MRRPSREQARLHGKGLIADLAPATVLRVATDASWARQFNRRRPGTGPQRESRNSAEPLLLVNRTLWLLPFTTTKIVPVMS